MEQDAWRERPDGTHSIVSKVEVRRAIHDLATEKAAGPDGFPTEIYKNSRALEWALTKLANLIQATGKFPKRLRRIYLAPLVKPGKDPREVEPRRPIAPINTTVEIMETVLHYRLIHEVEPLLSVAQYAYRRERSTEMCLVEITGAADRAWSRGRSGGI